MSVTLHGFSWDASSSFARGAAQGPDVIRSALFTEMSSPYSLAGVDARKAITRYDFEALPEEPAKAREAITDRIKNTLNAGLRPLSLGGDHSVTYPILKAMKDQHGPVNILHIDAHPDLYPELDGDPFSHACPFYRAVEDGCVNTLVQVGLRSVPPESRIYGEKHGIVMLSADELEAIPFERLTAPLYVSIDLDGIDPAFAPGVSHPEPGGLTSREVIGLIDKLEAPLIGADVVELNPARDINMMTAYLAARLVKELAAKLNSD
ncbi:agmatinase [Hyphococcus flavus]|uniref:Agmatinase n=1 Tax=Hyphococcus flavus TaxID=1866326 RepID=A0AAF0CET2_9PROT|nr:agmatinase [Hyphococcus flavus]WDI30058.1 agmatinase [Hyphococcus flavus]